MLCNCEKNEGVLYVPKWKDLQDILSKSQGLEHCIERCILDEHIYVLYFYFLINT